jgi:hypothetical protein
MKLALPMILTGLLTGCLIYDEELVYDDTGDIDVEDRESRDDERDEPGNHEEEDKLLLTIDPTGGLPGEVMIVSLFAEGADLTGLTEVGFVGPSDIVILANQSRSADEHLLTIDIAANSQLGLNHLLLEFGDDMAFVEDVFNVVGSESDLP